LYVNGYTEVDDVSFIDHAEASCAAALELNPNLDVVHTALGQLYASTGDHSEAEASFRRALRIDPSSAASFIGLGNVNIQQGRIKEAESNLRLAIGLHPGDARAYNQLGNFLYRSGRYIEAAEQYGFVVALNDENMNGYSNLGTALMLAGDFAAAAPAFQRALEIEPKKATYGNLGLMYYYLGNLDDAIENHQNAVELEPNDYLARSNLGDALWIAGRKVDARAAFERADELATVSLQVNPNDPYTAMDVAWINAMLGRTERAREFMNRSLRLAPEDPYTHYYNALVLLRGGDSDAALNALELAVNQGYPRRMMAAEPHLKGLRHDPRFLNITK
jgi:tetratricopeptide (TPR) repeat protein